MIVHKEVMEELQPPVEGLEQQLRSFHRGGMGNIVIIEDLWNAVLENVTCYFIAPHVLIYEIEEDPVVAWAECCPIAKEPAIAFF